MYPTNDKRPKTSICRRMKRWPFTVPFPHYHLDALVYFIIRQTGINPDKLNLATKIVAAEPKSKSNHANKLMPYNQQRKRHGNGNGNIFNFTSSLPVASLGDRPHSRYKSQNRLNKVFVMDYPDDSLLETFA